MNIALAIVQFLVNEILSVPAFLIGIITAVGLAAMRKSVGQIAGALLKPPSVSSSLGPEQG